MIRKIWKNLYEKRTWLLNHEYKKRILKYSKQLKGRLLDVGCGDMPWINYFEVKEYIGIDINNKAHIQHDITKKFPFEDNSFDSAICLEVLEHLPKPIETLKEIKRVLKPQSKLLVTTPQSWSYHPDPNDYYRYTKQGLKYLLEEAGFEIKKIEPIGGAFVNIGQTILNRLVHPYKKTFLLYYFALLISPIFLFLDKFDKQKVDTINNIVLAIKK